jgi:hypothetical protein
MWRELRTSASRAHRVTFRHWLMDTTNLSEEMEQPDSDSKSERWLVASDEALPLTDTDALSLSAREESLLFDLIGKIDHKILRGIAVYIEVQGIAYRSTGAASIRASRTGACVANRSKAGCGPTGRGRPIRSIYPSAIRPTAGSSRDNPSTSCSIRTRRASPSRTSNAGADRQHHLIPLLIPLIQIMNEAGNGHGCRQAGR